VTLRADRCEWCNKPLYTGSRADKRFCNSTCRSAHARSKPVNAVTEMRGAVAGSWPVAQRPPGTVSFAVSEQLAEVQFTKPTSDVMTWLRTRFPEAWTALGNNDSVVLAGLRPVPTGVCRTCIARKDATMVGNPLPMLDAAHFAWLGMPCLDDIVALTPRRHGGTR
jgi:hypothetical protein